MKKMSGSMLVRLFCAFVAVCVLCFLARASPRLRPTALRALDGAFTLDNDEHPPPRRKLTPLRKKKIAAEVGWRCALCHELLSWSFEIDHCIPLSAGGTDEDANLRPLCQNCHGRVSMEAYLQ